MKLKLFFLAALTLQLMANAQSRIKFESNNQIGLLSGTSKSALQLQTINGIHYKTFFAGAGIGIDNYFFKTIPVFADIRMNIFQKSQTPFIYADAGPDFPWEKKQSTSWQIITYRPGLYYDVGIGYRWTIIKYLCVNASFGFSQKKYNSTVAYLRVGNIPEVVPPEKYNYYLQRFTMKFGLSF